MRQAWQIRSTRSGVRRGWARRGSRVACAPGRPGPSGQVCASRLDRCLSRGRSRSIGTDRRNLSGTDSTSLTLSLSTGTIRAPDLSRRRTRGMDSFNPTTKTQQAISAAVQAASLAGNPDVGPTHLLGALLAQADGIAAPLLRAVGADAAAVRGRGDGSWATGCPRRRAPPSPRRSSPARRSPRSPPRSSWPRSWATSTSPPSTCWSGWPPRAARSPQLLRRPAPPPRRCSRRSPRCAAGAGHQPGPGGHATRRWRSTASTSPSAPATASSTRSSAGTPRSAASSRCCPGAPRTTRC